MFRSLWDKKHDKEATSASCPDIVIDIDAIQNKIRSVRTVEDFRVATAEYERLGKIRYEIVNAGKEIGRYAHKFDNLTGFVGFGGYGHRGSRNEMRIYDDPKVGKKVPWDNLVEIAKKGESVKAEIVTFLAKYHIEDFRITHGLPYVRIGHSSKYYSINPDGKISQNDIPPYEVDFAIRHNKVLAAYDYIKSYFDNEESLIEQTCQEAVSIDDRDYRPHKALQDSFNHCTIAEKKIYDFVSMFNSLPEDEEREDTGIPSTDMMLDNGLKILKVDTFLKERIIGQDAAIDSISNSVKNIWAGLSSSSQAVKGSYLFSGPTGVGKTETAKLLAEYLNMGFVRVDMSEYMEQHSISRLIGQVEGYRGAENGGYLTEAVKKKQHSVVLLDEVEKAHPDVFNVLLQVLDRGFLRDGKNREIDFRHTIIIMTTNAGQGKRSMGFGEQVSGSDKAISQFFSPEFRARLDGVVDYQPLTSASVQRITGLFLESSAKNLAAKRGVLISFSEAVEGQASLKSFSPEYGARHIGRYVRDKVLSVLTVPLLDGTITKGDKLKIDFNAEAEGYTWIKEAQNDNQKALIIGLTGNSPA